MTVQAAEHNGTRRHRFSVEDYHRMAEVGILSPAEQTELINGDIYVNPSASSEAAGHRRFLRQLLNRTVRGKVLISTRSPLQLGAHSLPQPDLTLLKPRDDYYASAHPTPEDILLVVEVADASLSYDRSTKIPLYARHGIPAVWLINLQENAVEVYERPDAEGYQIVHSLRGEGTVEHDELGLRFDVEELFV